MSSDEQFSNVIKNYFRMIYRPSEAIEDLTAKPVNLVNTFIVIIISSVLLIAGVFIAGDALYTTFQYHAFSYPLEIVTSGQLFGFILPYHQPDYYALVFLSDIIFCIKAWLLLSVLLYGFLRLFGAQISLKRSSQVIAWSIFPFALIMFGASIVCFGLKLVLPLYYHYIYFGVLAGVLIGVATPIIYGFLDRLKNVSVYNSIRAYLLSLIVVFVIWTINHPTRLEHVIF